METTAPATEPASRFRAEASRIREASLWAAERHYAAETPWYYWNYALGLPSTILAAAAGVAAFSKMATSAGGVSIVVAILSSLTTFLDPHKRASVHHTSAKEYEALYHRAGYFYRIESLADKVVLRDLETKLSALQSKFSELNRNSPSIPGRAYRIAEQKIKNNAGEVVRDPGDADRLQLATGGPTTPP